MILLLAAMSQELDAIKASMTITTEHPLFDTVIYEGTVEDQQVLLALTGIGKVTTAMTLTHILDKYPVTQILNIGSAGGLKENQHIGDVVISTAGSFHDRYFSATPDVTSANYFKTDQAMQKRLLPYLQTSKMPYHVGLMVSGDQFLSQQTPHYKDVLKYYPDAISVDMESTTVMQVAQAFNVPVLVIRSLSDVPSHDDHDGQFDNYLEFAAKQSATICRLYLQSL